MIDVFVFDNGDAAELVEGEVVFAIFEEGVFADFEVGEVAPFAGGITVDGGFVEFDGGFDFIGVVAGVAGLNHLFGLAILDDGAAADGGGFGVLREQRSGGECEQQAEMRERARDRGWEAREKRKIRPLLHGKYRKCQCVLLLDLSRKKLSVKNIPGAGSVADPHEWWIIHD